MSRDTIFTFWKLPSSERRSILKQLDVVFDADIPLLDRDIAAVVFPKIKERGLTEQFVKLVDKAAQKGL